MSEVKTPVVAMNVEYICDECGEGRMIHTGVCLLSSPPQYPHQCNKCGHVKTLRECYPLIRYEPIS